MEGKKGLEAERVERGLGWRLSCGGLLVGQDTRSWGYNIRLDGRGDGFAVQCDERMRVT